MAELENEVPTDEELQAYLDEWLEGSSISLLSGFPGNQKYYHPEVIEAMAFLSSRSVKSRFIEIATNTLRASLQRLNRLRRDDSFWKNTNRRPTGFKLTDLGERLLKEDSNDVLSLHTRAILNIVQVREFGVPLWVQLYRLNAVDLEYVVFSAMLLDVAGSPSAQEIASFLGETASAAKAEALLLVIQRDGGKLLGQWSNAVIADLRRT